MRYRRSPRARILAAMILQAVALFAIARILESNSRGASPPFTAEQVRFYEERVRPILESRCFKCHGAGEKVKGGLRLDSRAAILKGGELGPAVFVDRPEESLLLQAIRYEELEMPPGGKLPVAEQSILTRWVKEGLPWGTQPAAVSPAPASVQSGPASARSIAAARREWSHQPVMRPAVPTVKDRGWVRNPIDAFVLARLEAERLHPASEADRVTLIRRLTYDLTGLPPTPGEVERLPRRSIAGSLRATGQPANRFTPLRRALGAALAGPRPLRRDQRLRAGLGQAVRLAISRLCHRCLQRRQAVRSVHPRATGRRRDRSRLGRRLDRDGILSPGPLG